MLNGAEQVPSMEDTHAKLLARKTALDIHLKARGRGGGGDMEVTTAARPGAGVAPLLSPLPSAHLLAPVADLAVQDEPGAGRKPSDQTPGVELERVQGRLHAAACGA